MLRFARNDDLEDFFNKPQSEGVQLGKLLLSFVLLILIVAVSYFQAVRRQAKVDNSFILGKKTNQKEILELQSATDSLTTKIGQQEVIHAESLFQIEKQVQRKTDSLAEIISSQQQSLLELKKKGTPVKLAVMQKSVDSEKKHKELLAYYKKRYESLPIDLSEYEHKVAVFEIRQETSQKYAISLTEFNRIREAYKINF